MNLKSAVENLLLAMLLAGSSVEAFTMHTSLTPFVAKSHRAILTPASQRSRSIRLAMSSEETTPAAASAKDDEIERLRLMAAKLRAEAAALEAEQRQAMAAATERAFQKFDVDKDGVVTVQELKAGLEKALKKELTEARVKQLMADFDKSGDGGLQVDEFVTVDRFRNKLDALVRQEKAQAQEKTKLAKQEQEFAKVLESQIGLINDNPPSFTDKIVSVLPYLFPLLDGFQYARFLILENQDNPLAIGAFILYSLYRSIPFSGFIAFGVLYFLAARPSINRLVRFNMQQAIFLDIALFFPGLLTALIQLSGVQIPVEIFEISNDLLFGTLLIAIGYSTVSSLMGITPDKIPFISQAVSARVPTADRILTESRDFFSKQGKGKEVNGNEAKNKDEASTKAKEEKDDKVNKE